MSIDMDKERKRIAIMISQGEVSKHFGRTEELMLVDVEDGEIKRREILPLTSDGCTSLSDTLKSLEVESIVVGGIGGGAKQKLERVGIVVYSSTCDSIEDALGEMLCGKLTPGVEPCAHDEEGCDHPRGKCNH